MLVSRLLCGGGNPRQIDDQRNALVRARQGGSGAVFCGWRRRFTARDQRARSGDGPYFIAEADEYDYSFLWIKPDIAIVTNIEHDHPDIFPDLDAVERAYAQFVSGIKPDGTLIISGDDPGCRILLHGFDRAPSNVVTFGFSDHADVRIERVAGRDHFHMPGAERFGPGFGSRVRHNRLNAAACLAAAKPPESTLQRSSRDSRILREWGVDSTSRARLTA